MRPRIVICVDIDAPTVEAAYRRLLDVMGEVERRTKEEVQWESTEEWYDEDGDRVPPSRRDRIVRAALGRPEEER